MNRKQRSIDNQPAGSSANNPSRYFPPTRDPSPAEIRRICREEIWPTWDAREWRKREHMNVSLKHNSIPDDGWELPVVSVVEAIANAGQSGDRGHG